MDIPVAASPKDVAITWVEIVVAVAPERNNNSAQRYAPTTKILTTIKVEQLRRKISLIFPIKPLHFVHKIRYTFCIEERI